MYGLEIAAIRQMGSSADRGQIVSAKESNTIATCVAVKDSFVMEEFRLVLS